MFLYDSFRDRQSEAGSALLSFGRIKRVAEIRNMGRIDANPFIFDQQHRFLSFFIVQCLNCYGLFAVFTCLTGVKHKVDHNLLNT